MKDSLYVNPAFASGVNQYLLNDYFDSSTVIYFHTSTMPDVATLKTTQLNPNWAIKANIGNIDSSNNITQFHDTIQAATPVTTGTIKWFELHCFSASLFGSVCDEEDIISGIRAEAVLEECDLSVNPTPKLLDFTISFNLMGVL